MALEKDRELRYQHASDMKSELLRLKRDTDAGRKAPASSANVAVAQETAAQSVAQQPAPVSSAAVAAASSSSTAVPVAEVAAPYAKKLWKILVPMAVVLAAIVAGVIFWRSRQTTQLTDKDTIVLADFTNTTGDAVFDDALKQALAVDLEQSPFLNVLSDRRMGETLRLMGRQPNDHVSREVAQEICLRTGSKAILEGSISRLGSQYMVGLEAVNCGNGDTLAKSKLRRRPRKTW